MFSISHLVHACLSLYNNNFSGEKGKLLNVLWESNLLATLKPKWVMMHYKEDVLLYAQVQYLKNIPKICFMAVCFITIKIHWWA